jgi:hypothetical protein
VTGKIDPTFGWHPSDGQTGSQLLLTGKTKGRDFSRCLCIVSLDSLIRAGEDARATQPDFV